MFKQNMHRKFGIATAPTVVLALSAILAISSFKNSCLAAPVTIAFEGIVSGISGPSASSLAGAKTIFGEYTFESTAPDIDLDPNSGNYFKFDGSVLISVIVELPDLGKSWTSTTGSLQTFNDANGGTRDAFYVNTFIGSASGDPIGDLTPTQIFVQFADFGNPPAMLTSDALPTSEPAWSSGGFNILVGSSEAAFVLFEPNPIPVPAALPLFTTAIVGLGFVAWRKRKTA